MGKFFWSECLRGNLRSAWKPPLSAVSVKRPATRRRVPCAGALRSAFTVVELVVVIGVIVLVLALAVPGLSAMTAEMRLSAARQSIHSGLTRAYYLALGDVSTTAVRFLPGEWDVEADDETRDRQHMVIYRYRGMTYDYQDPDLYVAEFDEYFVRREGSESVALPSEVWAAPLESLAVQGDVSNPSGNTGLDVLTGRTSQFAVNANVGDFPNANFLHADDFLIIIDPKLGVRQFRGWDQPWRMRAYSPDNRREIAYTGPSSNKTLYTRYNFSGVVLYRRTPFLELGMDAAGLDRQAFLNDTGRPYVASRYGGGLTEAILRPN